VKKNRFTEMGGMTVAEEVACRVGQTQAYA